MKRDTTKILEEALKLPIEARAALAESIRLNPEVKSFAQWRAYMPWITGRKHWALLEKTLNIGLRRAGFPDE